ncbi:hypothetical protein M9H77_27190 [Catharanthus roseus]|uniref:Uncharacterized protein n=1 Tax=Catharanthus roseus TaxID=4058 RepID=A0ACC0AEH5_CATRO|nr:hypothetical protein M9H77_27190 [Catharanthus roseus]
MEEVPAHVRRGPIVPNVLTRQHEHRSGLICSGDHETYWRVELDARAPLGAMCYKLFDLNQLDSMPSDQFVWLPYIEDGLVPSNLWWAEVPLICYEIVEYHYPGRVM